MNLKKKSKYEIDDPKRFLREAGGWRAGMGGGLYCTLLGNFRILDVTVLPVHNEAGPCCPERKELTETSSCSLTMTFLFRFIKSTQVRPFSNPTVAKGRSSLCFTNGKAETQVF